MTYDGAPYNIATWRGKKNNNGVDVVVGVHASLLLLIQMDASSGFSWRDLRAPDQLERERC